MKYIPTLALALAMTSLGAASITHAAEIKNIVIAHGAFADGSSWRKVVGILTAKGFNVSVVQEPITSLADDVAATKRVLDLQTGPVLLVGHSYGGMVITEAGNAGNVVGLVYVAAVEPDSKESLFGLATSKPALGKGIRETKDGQYLYLDPAAFVTDFAPDIPLEEARFLAHAQVFASKQAATDTALDPAWRHKKSWAIVTTKDRSLDPDLQRDMAKRAGSKVTEIASSHAVYIAHADEVAAVIVSAATDLGH